MGKILHLEVKMPTSALKGYATSNIRLQQARRFFHNAELGVDEIIAKIGKKSSDPTIMGEMTRVEFQLTIAYDGLYEAIRQVDVPSEKIRTEIATRLIAKYKNGAYFLSQSGEPLEIFNDNMPILVKKISNIISDFWSWRGLGMEDPLGIKRDIRQQHEIDMLQALRSNKIIFVLASAYCDFAAGLIERKSRGVIEEIELQTAPKHS